MQIAMANKIIIPAVAAVKFPTVEVSYSDGSSLNLPLTSDGNDANASKSDIPKVSLLCLSFRASSQVRFVDGCCRFCLLVDLSTNIFPLFLELEVVFLLFILFLLTNTEKIAA